MEAELSELRRLIGNIIRLGTISGIDYANTAVRVKTGENNTDWLQWGTRRAGNVKEWDPPSIGEQVVIVSPGGNLAAGIVYPALYSDDNPTPSSSPTLHKRVYPDGAVIEYEFASHRLLASLPGGTATVKADQVTSDAPLTQCTGDLIVAGNVIVGKTLSVRGTDSSGASTSLAGKLSVSEDVVVKGISYILHRHLVTGIGALTEKPE